MEKFLRKQITRLAQIIANPYSFVAVITLSLVWIIYGLGMMFPEKWIEVTEVVLAFGTFFTVFIVQFYEEADTQAIHTKVDAIITADPEIDQSVIGIEHDLKGKDE